MVKKRTVRQKLRDKASKAPQEVQAADPGLSGQDGAAAKLLVGRSAQRKITKKLQFLSKIREAQAALSAKKVIAKKSKRRKAALSGLTLQDLSSLKDALPEFKEKPAKSKKILSHKDRQNLVVKETQVLQAVLEHPSFQADPYAAVLDYVKQKVPVLEKPVNKPVKADSTKSKKKNRKNKRDSMVCE